MKDAPNGVTLKPCERRNLEGVVSVEMSSFPDPYPRSVFAFYMLDPESRFTVACADDSVVGYVIAVRSMKAGTIQSIAVLPEFRGMKVGRSLMESAMEHLDGCRRVDLLVRRANERAIRLYRRFSFRETGRVFERYYPDGGDALEFELKPDERSRG
jgi:ribosomal-protein-alanine N-acetyltransferase